MARPATALLVLDAQLGAIETHGHPGLLPKLQRAIGGARQTDVPVIYVRVAFRPGHPEISDANAIFAGVAQDDRLVEGDPLSQIHPDIAPQPDDPVVLKRRLSAFSGSDLDLVLRAGQFRHLAVAGVSTRGVVLSTVRTAADLDYRITVLSDACHDVDNDAHRLLIDKVFPMTGAVLSVSEWVTSLQ